ncbi:hypothetical protein [Aurantiacibacter suaedae]|uniref:hypothetical protein n=1 Tax=Aurantiacibacter suaedae TaxID=2545755 RepID=UPI0010F82F4E|nr:hypothetical protein [Aurantiacibacter suaedae]
MGFAPGLTLTSWRISAQMWLAMLRPPAIEKYSCKYEVSRFYRQLLYGHRHDIHSELLIGLSYQSVSPDVVYQKAANPDPA